MVNGKLLDGRKIADFIHAETAKAVADLKSRGITPGIVFIRVGEDAASEVYVRMKEKKSKELGIFSETIVLPAATSEEKLLELICRLNNDPRYHGILVQVPLPSHISSATVFNSIRPDKDVDGFHPINMGKLLLGDPTGFVPCTPAGIVELLYRYGVDVSGKHVVILGRGNIVGKPLAALLIQKAPKANATVTVCHSYTQNIKEHCKQADILVAAIGVAKFVKADMVREGAIVIDVGVNRIEDPNAPKGYRIVGDVDFEGVYHKVSLITPNPGGVGPMTIAMLMQNTIKATKIQVGL